MCLATSRIGNKAASLNLKHIWPDPRRAITRCNTNAFFRVDLSMKFGRDRSNRLRYQVKPEMLQSAEVTKRLGKDDDKPLTGVALLRSSHGSARLQL